MHLQENTLHDLDLVVKVTQNIVQCPPNHMAYASANLNCYVQHFRRRWIYKKVNYMTLTLESRSHKMLPSTIHIM